MHKWLCSMKRSSHWNGRHDMEVDMKTDGNFHRNELVGRTIGEVKSSVEYFKAIM